MEYITKLLKYGIAFIISASLLLGFVGSPKAEKIDIKKEIQSYREYFKYNKDYKDISQKLETLDKYLNESIDILNKDLDNNKELYAKIDKYGKFDDHKVTLTKGKDKILDDYIDYLNENGIKMRFGEGMVYLDPDPLYIVTSFKDVLPEDILEFYTLLGKDINEGFSEDAGLTIPWDMLRMKIIRYENYLNKIKVYDCPYIIKLTKEKICLYLGAYLIGLNNSPINYGIKEARVSYEKFMRENKMSKHYEIIKGYYSELKRNNFRFGEKQIKKGSDTYLLHTVLDKNRNEISIYDVADKYLWKVKCVYKNYMWQSCE